MEPSSAPVNVQHFLILNGLIVTLVVLSFLVMRRAPKGPVKLELRDDNEVASEGAREVREVPEKPAPKFRDPRSNQKPLGWGDYQPRSKVPLAAGGERVLNVFFNWNGHTWDAYEVLGLPGGSSKENARIAHDRAAALADKETLPFLRAALDAILAS